MKQVLMKFLRTDTALIAVLAWLVILWTVYGGSVPYLDGGIDFNQAYDVYQGGLTQLFNNWNSVHPPLKALVAAGMFRLFGVHERTYTALGLITGIVGVVSFYLLLRRLWGRVEAGIGVVLLGLGPLFVAAGLFAMTDYLLACLVIIAFTAYLFGRNWIWGIALCLSVLTKETGVLLPAAFLLALGFRAVIGWRRRRVEVSGIVAAAAAIALFQGWIWYAQIHSNGPWSDWIFSDTPGHSATRTIIDNVLTGSMFNQYAYQNWQHLLILNFQWIVSVLAVIGGVMLVNRMTFKRIHTSVSGDLRAATVLTGWCVFSVLYVMLVLTFQTYTIPRYVLPVMPFVYLLSSVSLAAGYRKYRKIRVPIIGILLVVVWIRLFASADPLSGWLWGVKPVLGQRMYALQDHLSGNDGLTYNGQFLMMTKYRTVRIRQAEQRMQPVASIDCYFTFPDPNNDFKVLPRLGYTAVPGETPCVTVTQ